MVCLQCMRNDGLICQLCSKRVRYRNQKLLWLMSFTGIPMKTSAYTHAIIWPQTKCDENECQITNFRNMVGTVQRQSMAFPFAGNVCVSRFFPGDMGINIITAVTVSLVCLIWNSLNGKIHTHSHKHMNKLIKVNNRALENVFLTYSVAEFVSVSRFSLLYAYDWHSKLPDMVV